MKTSVEHYDLTLLWDIDEVRVSPDGARVAAACRRPDEPSNSYVQHVLVGSVESSLEQIDVGAPATLPRWTPDGSLVVVVHDEDGWSLRKSGPGGERNWINVTRGIPDLVEELSVSPDGRWLLFTVREPLDRSWYDTPEDRRPPLRLTTLGFREDGIGWTANTRRQAYLVPIRGGDPVRLTDGDYDDCQFSWHPDGGSVFFVSQRFPQRDMTRLNDVYRMAVHESGAGGQAERLTATEAQFAWPKSSPDGTLVSMAATDIQRYPEPAQLALLDLVSGQWRLAAPDLDRDAHADAVVWTANDRLSTLVDRSGRIELIEFDIPASDYRALVGGDFRVTAFDTRAGRTSYVRSGIAEPPRLLAAPAEELGDAADIHAPNSAYVDTRLLAAAEYRPVQVQEDVSIDSWLVRPTTDASGALPLIVWLQGGGTQFGYQWSHEVQLLAAQGYAVLYLNARGSAGYGTDWMRAVRGKRAEVPGQGWGVVDVADVSAVIEQTLACVAWVDRARVGVMGGSYGGLVTTHLMAQTQLFRAGWAERGPYNLYSDAGTKDQAPWFFNAYLGGDHRTDPESYWEASPLRLADGITDPLIIVHSENDYRCTIGQAEELFTALKLLGRDVEFARFPGEGHNLTRTGRPVHRLQRSEMLTEWFDRHLQGLENLNGVDT